jgi:hypothetical protein
MTMTDVLIFFWPIVFFSLLFLALLFIWGQVWSRRGKRGSAPTHPIPQAQDQGDGPGPIAASVPPGAAAPVSASEVKPRKWGPWLVGWFAATVLLDALQVLVSAGIYLKGIDDSVKVISLWTLDGFILIGAILGCPLLLAVIWTGRSSVAAKAASSVLALGGAAVIAAVSWFVWVLLHIAP